MSELKSYDVVADHKRALFEADAVMRYDYTAITPLSTTDVSKQPETEGVEAYELQREFFKLRLSHSLWKFNDFRHIRYVQYKRKQPPVVTEV